MKITGAEYSTKKSGNDLIIGVGNNSILVQNGATSSFKIDGTLESSEDELPDGWNFNETLATATSTSADDLDLTEDYGADIIRVNASKTTSGIEIIGNDNDNSIKGGKGADTIHGGDGNDTLSLGGGADIYVYSGGNDYIRDYAEGADKISLESGSIRGASISDSNVILNVSDGGNITLKNANGKSITIIDGKGKETSNIYPIDEEDELPDGWKFNETLAAATLTSADDLNLTEDYGADIIRVNASKTTSGIEIIGNDNDNSIKGGKGADTIHGGDGNDTLSLGGGADIYVYSGGNDYIRDYAEGADKISLESGSIRGASISDSNVILNVSDGGNITLKNANGKSITIIDGKGKETSNIYPIDEEDELPDGWKFNETLAAATLTSADDLDLTEDYGADIIRVNASKTTSGIEIIGNDLNNSIKGGKGADTIHGGDGNDTISLGGGADIYVYSGGNDYIRDYAEGADKISLESGSIRGASISDSNLILNVSDGGNITLKNANGKSITIIDGKGKETSNIYPVNEEDELPDGWKFNETLAAATLTSADDLDLTEDYGADIIRVNASKTTSGIEIIGNDNDNSIKGGKGADTIHGGDGNDTLSLGGGADIYVYSGGNDYIRDYAEGADKISLESGSIRGASISDSNVILNVSDGGNITLKNANGKSITIIDSKGKETSNIYPIDEEDELPDGWKFTETLAAATLTSADDLDLTEDYGADIIRVNASKTTSGIEIIGNDNDNSIKGGKGADTIHGGDGNDTISLGGGADIYVYSGGNDYIRDYAEGADKISLESGSIRGASISDSNVILNVSDGGNITLKNANGKSITIIDSKGKETSNIYPVNGDTTTSGISVNGTTLTASSSFSGNKIDLANYDGVTKVNAADLSQGVSIIGTSANNSLSGGKGKDTIYGEAGKDSIFGNNGNDKIYGDTGNDYIDGGVGNDTIYGGSGRDSIFGNSGNDKLYGDTGNDYIDGGAGNDTIYGGAGNDTLTGDNGKDIFVYNSGKDIITDYTAAQDSIQIESGTISNTSYSGNNVIFTIGTGSLTVQNGKGKNITIIDSNGKTTTQTYSNSRTLDLLLDNNFMTDDTSLDSITEQKYSVTDIQNNKVDNFAQDDNILIFAEEK